MAHKNVGFFEAWKITGKLSQPWQPNPAFSGAESLQGCIKSNMRNFLLLKMPRRESEIRQKQVNAIKP
jgi:hypothetical protein